MMTSPEMRQKFEKWALDVLGPVERRMDDDYVGRDVRVSWQAWQAAVLEAVSECPFCQHDWRRHDPEDGKCDAGPPCQCGRDLVWMQRKIAEMSVSALRQKWGVSE